MRGGFASYYLTDTIMAYLAQGVALPAGFPPKTLYIALCTKMPKRSDTGATIQEPSAGNGYARQALAVSQTNWLQVFSGIYANGVTVNFPAPTASWGTAYAVAVVDALTIGQGNLWNAGFLDPPQAIDSSAPSFAPGTIMIGFGRP